MLFKPAKASVRLIRQHTHLQGKLIHASDLDYPPAVPSHVGVLTIQEIDEKFEGGRGSPTPRLGYCLAIDS